MRYQQKLIAAIAALAANNIIKTLDVLTAPDAAITKRKKVNS